MEWTEFVQMFMNNAVGIAVAAYFLYKDWKQSEQRIQADLARASADTKQSELIRQLCETVNALKETVERLGGK